MLELNIIQLEALMFRNTDALIVTPYKVPLRKGQSLNMIVDLFLSMLELDDASMTRTMTGTILCQPRKGRVYTGESIIAAEY
jgi:hypothetical protein